MKRFFFRRKKQEPVRLAALFEDTPEEQPFLRQIMQKEQLAHDRSINFPADLQISPESVSGGEVSFSPEHEETETPLQGNGAETIVPDEIHPAAPRSTGDFFRFRKKSKSPESGYSSMPDIPGLPEDQRLEQDRDAAFFMNESPEEVRRKPSFRLREEEPSYRTPEVRASDGGDLQKIALYSGRQLRLIRKMCGLIKEQNRYYS